MVRGRPTLSLLALLAAGVVCAAADRSEGKSGDDFLSRLAAHKASASSSRAKHAAHRNFMAGHDDDLEPSSKVGQVALNSIYQSVATGGGAATGSAASEGGSAADASTAGAGPPPGVNPNCPADSIAHNMPGFENVCIWKPASSLDWNKAEALCQATGDGHLPSFTNQRELFFIESVASFTESFWIGMKRTASTGGSMAGWTFTDGSSVVFATTLWSPGQPNNLDGQQNCVELVEWGGTGESNRINDEKCALEFPFVCMKVVPPAGSAATPSATGDADAGTADTPATTPAA